MRPTDPTWARGNARRCYLVAADAATKAYASAAAAGHLASGLVVTSHSFRTRPCPGSSRSPDPALTSASTRCCGCRTTRVPWRIVAKGIAPTRRPFARSQRARPRRDGPLQPVPEDQIARRWLATEFTRAGRVLRAMALTVHCALRESLDAGDAERSLRKPDRDDRFWCRIDCPREVRARRRELRARADSTRRRGVRRGPRTSGPVMTSSPRADASGDLSTMVPRTRSIHEVPHAHARNQVGAAPVRRLALFQEPARDHATRA